MTAVFQALPNDRWRVGEVLFWLLPLAAYFLLPDYLILGSQILVVGLFAVSLDLILGYAGILSLGHAAFFGIGAYTAGLLAVYGWGEPFSGLLAAALVSALCGFLISFLVVRGQDLTQLMVTLGVGLLLFEVANKAASITGGVDGLSGVNMGKLFGQFAFDLNGQVAYLYCLAVVFLLFVVLRRVVHSPFGLSLTGIREQAKRMPAIGTNVQSRLVAVFTLSAAVAGVAGALLAQTTQFVGMDTLGFPRSAELLIMLVLGGTGRLYGGLVGAPVFMLMQDYLSGLNPVYWQFWIGLLLVTIVLCARGGIVGGLDAVAKRVLVFLSHRRKQSGAGQVAEANSLVKHPLPNPFPPVAENGKPEAATRSALRTEGLSKQWGTFQANSALSLSFQAGARHALIGPNGAGKTTFINLLTGALVPTSGTVWLGDENITSLPQHRRVKRGMSRTFQINTLFGGLSVLESVMLAILERKGRSSVWHTTVARETAVIAEAMVLLASLKLHDDAACITRSLPYGKQRLLEIALALATRPKILLLDEPAAGIPSDQSAELFEVIAALPRDVTILFIEHDMNLVFRFAERITVLVGGKVLVEGTPTEIAADARVREVYLGEGES